MVLLTLLKAQIVKHYKQIPMDLQLFGPNDLRLSPDSLQRTINNNSAKSCSTSTGIIKAHRGTLQTHFPLLPWCYGLNTHQWIESSCHDLLHSRVTNGLDWFTCIIMGKCTNMSIAVGRIVKYSNLLIDDHCINHQRSDWMLPTYLLHLIETEATLLTYLDMITRNVYEIMASE